MSNLIKEYISNESISFQGSDVLFDKLKEIVAGVRKEGKFNTGAFLDTKASAIIKAMTGISTDLFVSELSIINAMLDIDVLNKEHPFFLPVQNKNVIDKDLLKNQINKLKNKKKGFIDFKEGKVSGFFSEIPSKIYLTKGLMASPKFTDGEVTAILMHEIGHHWTYCAFFDTSYRTNLALLESLQSVEGGQDSQAVTLNKPDATEEEKIGFFKRLKESFSNKDMFRSPAKNDVYDEVSWEYVADQFASRHNAGRDLVTGLFKISKQIRSEAHVHPFFLYSYRTIALILSIKAKHLGGLISVISSILIARDESPNHDKVKRRIERIKEDGVKRLKDKALSKEDKKKIVEDIKAMDNMLSSLYEHKTLFEMAGGVLLPSMANKRKKKNLEQDLERLASSGLFTKAAEFEIFT